MQALDMLGTRALRQFSPARLVTPVRTASRTAARFGQARQLHVAQGASLQIHGTRQTLPRRWRQKLQPQRAVRYNSSNPRPNPTAQLNSPPAKLGLKDQLKRIMKEYGRGAVLVYLLFSAADLPVAFGMVKLFGPERVGAAEHAVLGYVKSAYHAVTDPVLGQEAQTRTIPTADDVETATVREGIIGQDATHIAAKARDGEATIWTQLALAYAIHKTLFLFVRIPLTVAFTPKIVKWMRRRGGFFEWVVGPKKVA